jgi:hypothetical protein
MGVVLSRPSGTFTCRLGVEGWLYGKDSNAPYSLSSSSYLNCSCRPVRSFRVEHSPLFLHFLVDTPKSIHDSLGDFNLVPWVGPRDLG